MLPARLRALRLACLQRSERVHRLYRSAHPALHGAYFAITAWYEPGVLGILAVGLLVMMLAGILLREPGAAE